MDSEDKHGIGEENHLQVLEAIQEYSCKDVQLQVSGVTLEDSSSSTVAMKSGLSFGGPSHCYDDCNIISSIVTIKSEEQPESKKDDNVSSP